MQKLHPAAERRHLIEPVLREKTGLHRENRIGANDVKITSVVTHKDNALVPGYVLESQDGQFLPAECGPRDDAEYPGDIPLRALRDAMRVEQLINPEHQEHRETQDQK